MNNNTFHRFPDLPYELRDQIWKFALRPALPGVHIFKLYNPSKDEDADMNTDVISYHRPLRHLRLAAPERKQKSTISTTSNLKADITRDPENPSTYLIDGGLWTACKESRRVVRRRFGYSKWRSLYEQDPEEFLRTPTAMKLDMPATEYFASKDPYYFTVFPNQDLFIIRPQNMSTLRFDRLVCWTHIGACWQYFDGFHNIALEYNQAYQDTLHRFIHGTVARKPNDITTAILDLVFNASGGKLWFVDYTLRPGHGAAAEQSTSPREEVATFYLHGRRFVEVDYIPAGSKGWECFEEVNREYYGKDTNTLELNSMHFVRIFKHTLCEFFAAPGESAERLSRRIGLLACDSP